MEKEGLLTELRIKGIEIQRKIPGKALEQAVQGVTIPGTAPEMSAPGTWGRGSVALGWHLDLEILEGFSNLTDSTIP